MSDLDLDRMEALANAATEGPWERRQFGYVFSGVETEITRDSGYEGTPIVDTFTWTDHGEGNVAFIAASRSAVPALIARVRELEAVIQRVKALLDRKTDAGSGFYTSQATEIEALADMYSEEFAKELMAALSPSLVVGHDEERGEG